MKKAFFTSACAGFALLLGACATAPADQNVQDVAEQPAAPAAHEALRLTSAPLPAAPPARLDQDSATKTTEATMILPGTGNFINGKAAAKPTPVIRTAAGEITLNFEEASIRDVVKVIFDTLKENYTIDPQVQGELTVQTGRPLARDQLLPTLETLLRANNAVLVREGGVYRIVPAAGAAQRGNLVLRLGQGGAGYGVRIVPLRYVSATEMQTIITPFLPEGGVLRADSIRNLLILGGTSQELANAQTTIDTFDVNWLKGMSIGMFRLRNVDSQAVASELNQFLGEGSGTPIAGMLKFVPLSKLNAVLVITPQLEYLKEAAVWIERLDGIGGERLYVYSVQNSRADYVAELLNGLFNLSGGGGTSRGGDLAPGLKSAQLSSGGGSGLSSSGSGAGLSGGGSGTSTLSGSSSSGLGGSSASGAGTSGLGGSASSIGGRAGGRSGGTAGAGGGSSAIGSGGPSAGMEEVRIVADTENNSLLIWATNQNYERIISTLQKLDVTPRQVLIEATIAEVTLTGRLQYGLQWFFTNDVGGSHTGTGSLGINADDLTINDVLAGRSAGAFSYAITDSAGLVRALLNTLASDSKVKVLSAPHVMVVDNQQAVIRVGTQQPIPSGTTTTNNVTTSGGVQYKDTGVLLEVLPRVNSGGMVNMEIKQETIDLGPLVETTQISNQSSSSRSFLQRSVTSKVVVKSGQTLVLGGLIRDNRSEGQSGFPILYKIPVLGALFGNTDEQVDRTELIVLITPRVVENSQEADQVTEEIKRRMRELAPMIPTS
ncbi:MAG: type II secretion system secretin GspD [Candidatus Competibacter sp.]|nr:type II secretion system secretin GspD [Candidatus Competibacter sp.]MDG4584071.1 type II secretion system secretin GspD [Candidatus Competibacter sp.]